LIQTRKKKKEVLNALESQIMHWVLLTFRFLNTLLAIRVYVWRITPKYAWPFYGPKQQQQEIPWNAQEPFVEQQYNGRYDLF
jgi:hypothetical protein